MIVRDPRDTAAFAAEAPPTVLPSGLPPGTALRAVSLTEGRRFDLLLIPSTDAAAVDERPAVADLAVQWATANPVAPNVAAGLVPAAVTVPLYGCHVVWTATRGAVIGPADRLEQLATTLAEFATCETALRNLEVRGHVILATVEADAPAAFECDERTLAARPQLAARFREAVAVRRGLAELGPAVHVPPIHPPTLASQLAERLRDRTRLAERHELAGERTDFAVQIYEACGQRVSEFALARKQIGLEWAIIVILVAQVALMLVELLGSGSGT